ncbi:thaumatin family protein [Legionella hackeliae]|uniref:Thaumatin domain-containing protein n=1 Tax=Legionella hackeliae TaxID=449 RepID=A0A0A8UWA1_LEGHA|nr:thaumatin family protein [Legionella hackeliae]KTD09644.1 thaumatin domain-containing protein [Legionella hackeliae]CEK11039.1 exported protein of unknown function [Thaumatin, pathogenesis-related] [Legionella hackeliae]STX47783.1 thaumatin domain-containing protein [Legionella hackeliae]
MNVFISICSLILSLLSISTSAIAAPLFIATYPQKYIVSYGANHQTLQLQYTIVSNLANRSQDLSKFGFASAKPDARILLKSITNTCRGILPPQGPRGVCTVNVNLQVTGIQYPSHTALPNAAYHLLFTYGSGRGTTMSSVPIMFNFATGATIPTAARTFIFKNNCNYNVWLGISGGATNSIKPAIAGDAQSCKDTVHSSDCYPGSVCIPVSAGVKHCFWKNPTPTGGNYNLTQGGGSATVTFPVYNNGIDAQWSGGVAGRTNCTSTSCDTGDCNGGATSGHNGACKTGTGFNAPVSTAEFTLLGTLPLVYNNTARGNTDKDTYDVTIINGISTAISMAPSNGTWGGSQSPYSCGVPGATTNVQSSAACDWSSFNPPNLKAYRWVKYTNTAVQDQCLNTNCAQGECGAAFNPGNGGVVLKNVCGTPLGYWTADAFCAKDSTFQDSRININCSAHLASPDSQYTQAELYGCSKGIFKNSCYTAGAVSGSCCGCVNWNTLGINVPAPPITQSCGGVKTDSWVNVSQPKLEWLKEACSNAYVYPYDDASSTFTCQKLNSQNINQVNYLISFCPQT